MKRLRIRTAMRGLLATIVLWAVLAIAAQALGAVWPHAKPDIASCFDAEMLSNATVIDGETIAAAFDLARCKQDSARDQWESFFTFAFVIEFLWLKSWMMGFMTRRWDNLASSLIAANIAFSVVYLLALIAFLFARWTWIDDGRELIRYGLILTLAWGFVQLLLVEDPEASDA